MGAVACTAKANSDFVKLEDAFEPKLHQRSSTWFDKTFGDTISSESSDYAFCGLLGVGNFSRVYLALAKQLDYDHVAVKITPHSHKKQSNKFYKREVTALENLSHPCILRLVDYAYHQFNNIVVTEYCLGGTALDRAATQPFNEGDLNYVATQLVEALEHCHANEYVHRDVKPKNILFSDEDQEQIVLSGFGLALKVDDTQLYTHRAGTVFFMAPELAPQNAAVLRTGATLKACDVFSLGVTLFFLLTERYPFGTREMTNDDVWKCICDCKTDLDFKKKVSRQCYDFISRCLHRDPHARITMKEATMHRWIIGGEWGEDQ